MKALLSAGNPVDEGNDQRLQSDGPSTNSAAGKPFDTAHLCTVAVFCEPRYQQLFEKDTATKGPAENELRPFQLSISSELFFTDNEPYFERNSLLFALQYRVAESTSLQIGYLHQFDYKINDETGRSFLVAALYFEIFRNSGSPPYGDLEIQNN